MFQGSGLGRGLEFRFRVKGLLLGGMGHNFGLQV